MPHSGESTDDLPRIEDGVDEEVEHPPIEVPFHAVDEAPPMVSEGSAPPSSRSTHSVDDTSDSGTWPGAVDSAPVAIDHGMIDWATETNAQRIAAELRRIEAEVRRLLEARDPKRKRKMAGTRRWFELEEDIISWKFSDRFDQPTLRLLSELIAKRHHLYARLRFLAATRPTWNS